MGSVFDPQPSESTGNLHCISNPEEPVIGYIIVSPVYERRIFIDRAEVSGWNFQLPCSMGFAYNTRDSIRAVFEGGANIPADAVWEDGRTTGYFYSTNQCMDCRITGSSVKPDFW